MSQQPSDFGEWKDEVRMLTSRLTLVEEDLKKNTEATKRVEQNTQDIVEAFNNAKGAYKVLEGIGRLGKLLIILFGIPGSIIGAWVAIKQFLK